MTQLRPPVLLNLPIAPATESVGQASLAGRIFGARFGGTVIVGHFVFALGGSRIHARTLVVSAPGTSLLVAALGAERQGAAFVGLSLAEKGRVCYRRGDAKQHNDAHTTWCHDEGRCRQGKSANQTMQTTSTR